MTTLLEKVRETWNVLTSGRKPEAHPVNVAIVKIPVTLTRGYPMLSYLKVKIKSLAEEASIIRHEERRVKRSIAWWREPAPEADEIENSNTQDIIERYQTEYFGLHNHRTYEVRNESRAAQLAYAFVKGYPYNHVEDPVRTRKPVPTGRVAQLVMKYGTSIVPPETPYKDRLNEAIKIIHLWSEGKTHYKVPGTSGQVLRPIQK